MKITRLAFFIILVAASLPWSGCRSKNTFRIGLAGASTGIFYISWQAFYEGAQLAATEINSQGGVFGKPVELFPTDDQVKVDIGVSEMKKLILRDKVHIVIGGSASHVAAAQSDLALRYRVPFIIGNCNSAVLAEDKGHRYLFQLTPSSRMEANAVAIFIAKQDWKRLCYIMPDYEWGHTFKKVLAEKLSELAPEIEVLAEFWPKIDESEYTSYITAIQTKNPDTVVNGLGGASLINFTKQAMGYGLFESTPVIGLYDLNILKALGRDMPEGAIGFHRGAFFSVPGQHMREFVKKFRASYEGEYPAANAVFGYEAVHMARLAAEKAGTLENLELIVDALSKLHFKSPKGDVYFRNYHNQSNASVYIGFTQNSQYPFLTYRDTLAISAEETWPTIDVVKTLRQAARR